jgi:hypothetical protein
MHKAVLLISVFSLLATLGAAKSHAASVWNNPTGGVYSNAGNWLGGVPGTGTPVTFNLDGTYTVTVDVAANHGATQFSANSANVTLDITGPGYTIAETVEIGKAGGTNHVTASGSSFMPTHLEIAPLPGGIGHLTLGGPMQASVIGVGGKITDTGSSLELTGGGRGTLTLNPGADLNVDSLIAEYAGDGSQIVFNGGALTIQGDGRFSYSPMLTQIGDGTNPATLNLLNGIEPGSFRFSGETLTIGNNATLNFNSPGGQLVAEDILRDTSSGTPGVFNWVAGTLVIEQGVELNSSGLLGASVVLTPERSLMTHQQLIAPSGSSLTLSGGDLYAGTLMINPGATVIYNRGAVSVSSGALEIGPNGIQNPAGIVLSHSVDDSIFASGGPLSIASGHSLTLNGGLVGAQSIATSGLFAFNSGHLQAESSISIGPTGQINNSPNILLDNASQISITYGDIAIEPGQSVTVSGGGLFAERIINDGTLIYNSGHVGAAQGDLTLGPTGQFRSQSTFNIQGSLQAPNGTITFEQGVTANLNGAYLSADHYVIGGDVMLASTGSMSPESITIASADGAAKLTVGQNVSPFVFVNIFTPLIHRGDLIVNSGIVSASIMAPPPSYAHDSGATINGGTVYGWTMNVGADTGYVDTLTVNGGSLYTTSFMANQGAASQVVFNGGTILMDHAVVDGPSAFTIGNGSAAAKLILWGSASSTQNFADGLVISASGELVGDGIITGDVTNNGNLSPGQGFGTITVNGSLMNHSVLRLDIYDGSLMDKLAVNGTFDAAGVIAVAVHSATPAIGETFDVLDATTFVDSGYTFDFAGAPLPEGLQWDFSRFAVDGTLRVVEGDTADFNGDGAVDAGDYVVWRKTDSGNLQGYADWWRSFGAGGASSPSQNGAPEPATLVLLTFALVGLWLRRGPHRSCALGTRRCVTMFRIPSCC